MEPFRLPLVVYGFPKNRDTHQGYDQEDEGGENSILWGIQGIS